MPKLSQVFSGNYLKAEDLQGRKVPVTIASVEAKDFDDGKKLIITFEGKDKTLVCNKTNASILEELCGSDDTDDWVGKRVVMMTKKVEFQGKLVPAIRFDLEGGQPQPTPTRTVQPQVTSDEGDGSEIPF